MERLTKRDRKGRAYFDNDGVLLRGANGVFHQKKDMTAHYIHDRFVALDKVLDRLAAYEDIGLEPEEIKNFLKKWCAAAERGGFTLPPNTPLSLDELREMDGEPVWISPAKGNGKVPARWMLISGYNLNKDIYLFAPSCNITQGYDGKSYGKTWLAYRRKQEEGSI